METVEQFTKLEEAIVDEQVRADDCFCSWLTTDEVARRSARAASVAESRSEAVRILRLIEAGSGGDREVLLMVAKAWMDLAHIPQ